MEKTGTKFGSQGLGNPEDKVNDRTRANQNFPVERQEEGYKEHSTDTNHGTLIEAL